MIAEAFNTVTTERTNSSTPNMANKPKADSALDGQVDGDHYKKMGIYQPWVVCAEWLSPEELKGFMKGTVVSYLARENDKGKRKDIKKALHSLQLYLELSEGKQTEQVPTQQTWLDDVVMNPINVMPTRSRFKDAE